MCRAGNSPRYGYRPAGADDRRDQPGQPQRHDNVCQRPARKENRQGGYRTKPLFDLDSEHPEINQVAHQMQPAGMQKQRRQYAECFRAPPGRNGLPQQGGRERGLHAPHVDQGLLQNRTEAGIGQVQEQAQQR